MRASRLPPLLPRLAIAAAAPAAGAIIFTTAGGLVAFGLWADHPPRGDGHPIVLRTTAPEPPRDRRPFARAPTRPVAAAAPQALAPAGSRRHRPPPPAAVTLPREPKPLLPRPHVPRPIEPAPPPPPPAQPAMPVEPLTAVVGESANALERALQSITRALTSLTTPGGS